MYTYIHTYIHIYIYMYIYIYRVCVCAWDGVCVCMLAVLGLGCVLGWRGYVASISRLAYDDRPLVPSCDTPGFRV